MNSRRNDEDKEACEEKDDDGERAYNGEGWEEGGGTRSEGGGGIGRRTKISRGSKNDEKEY